jgi:uncharacterized protein (TIGR00369 family)
MKNMERWLGDGGMSLLPALGATFAAYGEEDGGWAEATWVPTELGCNPHGIVQAGVHSVIHDAAMNFAINTMLDGRDRTRATLDMKTETMRVVRCGDAVLVRGSVVRMARQVAYAESKVLSPDGTLSSRATATFLLHRETPPEHSKTRKPCPNSL